MKRLLIITACICHLTLVICHSASALNGVATDPSRDQFGARQLGMGGVGAAFGGDANAIFSAPASLTGLEFPQLTAASRKLLLDETQYSLLGWAMPTDHGTFGIGYIGMGAGGSLPTYLDPATGRILQNPSQEVGGYENSVIALSFCREIVTPVKMALGGNLKIFNQSLAGGSYNDRGTGLSLDLGANYRFNRWLNLGANLQNVLGGGINWSGSQDQVGGYYKFGSKINVLGATEEALIYDRSQQLFAGVDIDLPTTLFHLGCEYFPVKNIALRAGLNQENGGTGLTFGVGTINGGIRFDYAYAQRSGLPGDNPHYFSLSYIGERVLTTDYKLLKKTAHLKFLHPRDRLITDKEESFVTAEAWAEKVLAKKRTWTVTAISATFEVQEVTTREDLAVVSFNGKEIKNGTVEGYVTFHDGRNVIPLIGFTHPEIVGGDIVPTAAGTAELHVLRIVPFKDVSIESWAIEPISLNVTLGLVSGYPNNEFKPEKGITRAELVTLLVRSLGIGQEILDAKNAYEAFRDVPKNHWAAKYIVYGSEMKLVSGYADETFKPNKVLNRAEGVTIMARYAGLTEEAGLTAAPFPDLRSDFWGNKYIAPAKAAGLLKFLAGKAFKPSEKFTRAEACEVLYQVPSVQKKVDEFWEIGIISAGSR